MCALGHLPLEGKAEVPKLQWLPLEGMHSPVESEGKSCREATDEVDLTDFRKEKFKMLQRRRGGACSSREKALLYEKSGRTKALPYIIMTGRFAAAFTAPVYKTDSVPRVGGSPPSRGNFHFVPNTPANSVKSSKNAQI